MAHNNNLAPGADDGAVLVDVAEAALAPPLARSGLAPEDGVRREFVGLGDGS